MLIPWTPISTCLTCDCSEHHVGWGICGVRMIMLGFNIVTHFKLYQQASTGVESRR